MRYTNGNYEAFARPRKPEGADEKTAWILGSGLAGLSAAAFLVRDAQVPGKNIHILEQANIAGGALDGIKEPEDGFVIRGGREMENHFETLWDLFRSVPSLEIEGASVLDEFTGSTSTTRTTPSSARPSTGARTRTPTASSHLPARRRRN
nr:oleate hydratase [Corynebacterium godavarianum]